MKIAEDKRQTYAESPRQVAAFGHALTTRSGIRQGDRVALAKLN